MLKSKLFATARLPIFLAGCAILVFQASASRMLKVDEEKIGVPGLHAMPWQIGEWKASEDQSIDADTVAYLRPDEYILRDYANAQRDSQVSLFVAYFKSLQSKYGPHSPRICLPGAGWLVTDSKIANIAVPGRAAGIPVNEYTMEKSNQRILVLYWYQNDRDVWAEEYHAKLRLLPDLIRYRRSDVSLVRLITPLAPGGDKAGLANCLRFTGRVVPLLAERFASVTTQP